MSLTTQAITRQRNPAKHFKEINFECTSLGSPQKNVVIEQGFDALYSHMRTMMAKMGIPQNLKACLFPEYAATENKLDKTLWSTCTKKTVHMRNSAVK